MNSCILKKSIVLLLALFVVAGFAFAEGQQEGAARGGGRDFIRFGGGSPGGSWFPTVGGLASYLSTHHEDLNVTAVSTGGSADNNRQARQGNLDTWLTHSLTAYENWTGTGMFDGKGEFQDFRLLSGVYENLHHFVTLESSDIESFSDLKGKKIVLGNVGSGGAVNSENVLRALGLFDEVEALHMSWDEAGRALMDGRIDAMGASSAPLPAVVTVDAQRDIKLIEPTEEEYDQIISEYPIYSKGTIPGGTYSSVPQDTNCIMFLVFWAAQKDLSNEAVYNMLDVALDPDNQKDISNIHGNLETIGPYLEAIRTFVTPLHPGAVEYYRDQGMEVPEDALPPEMK